MSKDSIVFEIKVKSEGKENDNITVKRKSYIAIQNISKCFSESQLESIKSILAQNSLVYYTKRDSVWIEVPDMFTAMRLLENEGWTIREYLPFSIWQAICDSMLIPSISFDALEKKIGPDIWQGLHSYQKVAVQKIVEKKICYIGDEMGCGKTLESLVGCYYFREQWPVLVVCPSSLRYNWKSEIMQWLHVNEERIVVVKASKDLFKKVKATGEPIELPQHDFLIISYPLLARPDVNKFLYDKYRVIVLDEVHYTKSMNSKRSHATDKVASKAEIRILLSGTPFNYPVEMYQQMKIMNPNIYPWFFNNTIDEPDPAGKHFFAKRYCKPHKIRFRNQEQWVFKGFDRHEELNAVLNTLMVRRKKLDVLTELPEKSRICITLEPLTKKQEKQIADLLKEEKKTIKKEDQKKNIDEKKSQVVVKHGNRDKFMESFRLANQFKIPHVLNFLKDHILDLMSEDKKMKTLIFMHHDAMREALEECLTEKNFSYFVINGATSAQKRQTYVQDFQKTNKYRIALLSITAAGVGLTLTAANTVVFTEILFNPDTHLQAESRVDRMGQKNTMNIFYLLQPKTTDDINFGLIKKKERESSLMIDGTMNHILAQRISLEKGEKLMDMIMPPPSANKTNTKRLREDQTEESSGRLVVKRARTDMKVLTSSRPLPTIISE